MRSLSLSFLSQIWDNNNTHIFLFLIFYNKSQQKCIGAGRSSHSLSVSASQDEVSGLVGELGVELGVGQGLAGRLSPGPVIKL